MKRVITVFVSSALLGLSGCGNVQAPASGEVGSITNEVIAPILWQCHAKCSTKHGSEKINWVSCAKSDESAENDAPGACTDAFGPKSTASGEECSMLRSGKKHHGQPVSCTLPGGGGWGDPHMNTFDGLRFEYQPLGEFVLATDNETYAIHVRTEQYGLTQASIQTAVSVDVGGGNTVALYALESPSLRINNAPAVLPCGDEDQIPNGKLCAGRTTFDNGASVVYNGDKFSVYLADQVSHLDVWLRGSYLNTQFFVGPAIQENTVGILGNINGNPSDDFMTRDGKVLAQPVAFNDVYSQFAASWRLSDSESLFAYQPGKSSSSYSDLSFPHAALTVADLPQADHSAALAACKAAGVPNAALDQCVLDAALIGGNSIQDFLHVGTF